VAAWFYILRLKSGTLYTGATTNLETRYQHHLDGTASHTTRLDPPVALLYSEHLSTFAEAFKREQQVKGWTRAKKLALVSGDMNLLKEVARQTRHGKP
jgi:putative endonuclease